MSCPMYRTLSDLRILKMAAYLEETFEAYEKSLRDAILQVPVRARLAKLFEGGPSHKLLKQALRDTEREAQGVYQESDTGGLLQTLLECEKIAHAFYIDQLDRLSSPKLVGLFQEMAAEEATHIEAVEAALRIFEGLPRQR